jgi:hypothetical protein
MRTNHPGAVFVLLGIITTLGGAVHCSSEDGNAGVPATSVPVGAGGTEAGAAPTPGGGKIGGDGVPEGGSGACVAPDMLIALDRTFTMSRRPDGTFPSNTATGRAESKWAMAIDALRRTVTPPLDKGVRFGLELWPKVNSGCLTLSERLGNPANGSGPQCQGSELLVSPGLDTGAQILGGLDPEATKLCYSTPTGTALLDAKKTLEGMKAPGKKQFVILLTDGADWDQTCPLPNPIEAVDQLAAAGVGTLVVGFSAEASVTGGVGRGFLDDMACAGGLAKGFPAGCEKQGSVYRATRSGGKGSATTPPLFYSATNTAELTLALSSFANAECCGCVR